MHNHDYQHRHAAHCESGVTSALMRHYGLDVSEALAFGLSSALVFVHMPFVKVGGFPLTAYRMWPGAIIKGLSKALQVPMKVQRYRRPEQGMADLDRHLAAGRVVGLQTSVFWLPYFPPDMRFHFNAHNLLVYGKEGDEYLISDPVFEHVVRCPAEDLQKARFVKGVFAPKGMLYYPEAVPQQPDLSRAIGHAIKKTAFRMVHVPLPFMGVRGIRTMAKTVANLPIKHPDLRYGRMFVGNIVRMQEEIGTGGAGFRFMFASFLQEAHELTDNAVLAEAAERMTDVGDSWREFALQAARLCRDKSRTDFDALAQMLRTCADNEEQVYRLLLAKR